MAWDDREGCTMRIAVLGTGGVGQAIAGRAVDLGHEVSMGTRDVEGTRSRDGFAPAAELMTFAEAAAGADVIVNATSGEVSLSLIHI
jgi:predicted dinucleotide-binding enzyme